MDRTRLSVSRLLIIPCQSAFLLHSCTRALYYDVNLRWNTDRDRERPADVLIPNFTGGLTLCLDVVTVVDSFGYLDQVIAPPPGEGKPKPVFNAKRAADLKRKNTNMSWSRMA